MKGSLSYQDLIQLQKDEFLKGFHKDSLQPASIDLSISDEAYRLRGSILPHHGEKVRDLLNVVARYPHDLSQPFEPGQIYLCKVSEQVRLPGELYGYTNPKSSTGRNDIQARLLADGVPRFDTVPRGFSGELWVLVTSRHFLLKLSPGDRLLQLRLFDTDIRIGKDDLQDFYNTHQLLWTPDGKPISLQERKISDHDGTLILAVDLESEEIVGYRAKPTGMAPVLEFNKQDHSVEDFFSPIARPQDAMIMLEQSRFYIFYTYEWLRVPPQYAAEMMAMDERSGEFRSHYAGFIDPGWGHGRDGQIKGWPIVLEIRAFDDNLIIRHKQPIFKLQYGMVRMTPERLYGETGSHYTFQKGAMLSKHFRPKEYEAVS